MCRVFSHGFRVVRLYSNYIFAKETRCAGWFKRIEPPRTFANHISAEIARCVEFFHMSSGWFDCTEPSLTTSFQGKQGLQGAYALVRGGSSASNLLEPSRTSTVPNLHLYRGNKVCRVLVDELYTPCYPCIIIKMYVEKVQYSRNSCETTLHTLLSLQ